MDSEADSEAESTDPSSVHDVGRTLTFSDGVFAIAVTLLVLNLPVPDIAAKDAPAHLLGAVADLLPRFGAFVLSFALVGMFWNLHRRLFRRARSTDTLLIWLNLSLLMMVCLVPFSTGLVSRYGETVTGFEIYALNLTLIAGLFGALRWHGERSGLVDSLTGHTGLAECFSVTFLFVLVMAIGLVNVSLAYAAWALTAPANILARRLLRRLSARHPSPSGSQ